MPLSNHPTTTPPRPRLTPNRGLVALGLGLGLAEAAAIAIGGADMPAAIAIPCLGLAAISGYLVGHGRPEPRDLPAVVPAPEKRPDQASAAWDSPRPRTKAAA